MQATEGETCSFGAKIRGNGAKLSVVHAVLGEDGWSGAELLQERQRPSPFPARIRVPLTLGAGLAIAA
jgi:hypothetical protein